ncbi:hypothetical protein TBLA_0C05470 [Henningerozyma blattae CBS 6284]|uniref:Major facilitator superfamily (MFS) profile domain-containing protein n=1 Tax=Henningerozyma blattae (strain ATCC 34711 / CBS 6284 / DSM 70876 / NBRC 10599 / NRRL Y-10934 / UCD 77-7) TaxID=1071380 RepID=I2H1U3_HENB6|nr:hypothetical protein TBLA_0C05470 [Tetrapisispora blattae CBS 6284]CCH60345.1 hypothetical protein TBLA_0C05470 [Tetrapisispora blattae CBS 6284]
MNNFTNNTSFRNEIFSTNESHVSSEHLTVTDAGTLRKSVKSLTTTTEQIDQIRGSDAFSASISLNSTISKNLSFQANKEIPEELDKQLTSRFDLADAIRLKSNCESDTDDEDKIKDLEHSPEKIRRILTENSVTSGDVVSMVTNQKAQDCPLKNNSGAIIEKVFTNKESGEVSLPPEGGYGWVCVVCSFLIFFSTWGCNAGFGVFLAFYLNDNTYAGASKYDYALIAGFTVFLGQGLCPVVAFVMRVVGFKPPMLFGVVLLLAGFLMASWATRLWELYLTQGVLSGASIAFIFVPATTVLPGWFLKKRAVAIGITLIGTGAGGVTFGLAAHKMIDDNHNTHWCLRMLAITCSITCLIAITFIKQHTSVKPVGFKSFTKIKREWFAIFNRKTVFKPVVLLIAAWFTFALFAYNLMIFTISPYCISKGLSSHDASTITAILNGSQAIGRPIMGLIADRYGRTNVTVVLTFFLMLFVFAFWITAHTLVQLIFFAIMLGSCVGVANVMNTVLIADIVPPEEFLASWATVNYLFCPMLLFCEVIAQALVKPERKNNPYIYTQIFSGFCFFIALCLIIVLRECSVRIQLQKKSDKIDEQLTILQDDNEKLDFTVTSKSLEDDSIHNLKMLREKYDNELKGTPKAYFKRMFKMMAV